MSAVLAQRKATRTGPLNLSATVEAPGIAREWLAERLRVVGAPKALVNDALIAISELVTNAYLHVDWQMHPGVIVVYARLDASLLAIEVQDTSMTTPLSFSAPEATEETGRGLLLVKALTDELECKVFPGGKAVIARIRNPLDRPFGGYGSC